MLHVTTAEGSCNQMYALPGSCDSRVAVPANYTTNCGQAWLKVSTGTIQRLITIAVTS